MGSTSVVCYAARSGPQVDWLANLSVGGLLAGASLAVGGVLGFIFGIPRTLQQDAAQDKKNLEGKNPTYLANTNLEQISDWLTKILVGVGLTQLTSIDQKLALISSKIAPGLGNTGSEQAFISGCIVFFSVCGFLESFLWTRINMANVLKHADLEEFINQVQGQGDKDARALSLVNSILNPSLDMPPVTDAELIPAIQDASPSVKVQIFYLAQDMRSQHWQKNKAIMERTIPVFRGLIASDPQDLYHRNHGQLGYALKDKRVPDFQQAEAELTKAIEIRDKNGISGWQYYEWNRALCRIAMDKNFLAGQNSSGEYRELILKDLRVAAESELRSKISVPEIIKWCTVNNIDPQKLA